MRADGQFRIRLSTAKILGDRQKRRERERERETDRQTDRQTDR